MIYTVICPRNVNLRAQDAPHSIGGKLASQFSWYALHHSDAIFRCNKYKGITTILRNSGDTKGGCRTMRLSLRKRITLATQCSTDMD
jgi:hypothetical protein